MTNRPHVFIVRTTDDRPLAALIGRPAVKGVELTGNGPAGADVDDHGTFTRDLAVRPATAGSGCARSSRRRVPRIRLRLPTWELEEHHAGLFNPTSPGSPARACRPQAGAAVRAPGADADRAHPGAQGARGTAAWPAHCSAGSASRRRAADRAARRHLRARLRDRRQLGAAPAGHPGPPVLGHRHEVARRGPVTMVFAAVPELVAAPDRGRRQQPRPVGPDTAARKFQKVVHQRQQARPRPVRRRAGLLGGGVRPSSWSPWRRPGPSRSACCTC